MKKIRSNGVSALKTTPVYASQLNEVTEVVNKSLGLDGDGDGDFIPENVYPIADGNGGFVAGNIKELCDNKSIAIGLLALGTSKETQENNIAIGKDSLYNLSTETTTKGERNVAIGTLAGQGVVDGNDNIFIGHGVTNQNVNANNSVAIGCNASKSNQAVVGGTSVVETVTRGVEINTCTPTSKNATATLTAAECLSGVITSTSAAAVELTLPSAADLIAVLNGGAQGTTFELIIDNSAGANSVTIVPSATITALTSPVTITDDLIVTTAQKVGCFKFYFISSTAAVITRVW